MSVFVATGEEARNMNSSSGGNYEWLRLKDGEKKRVMFLTTMDQFASYYAHNDFQRKINTHACLAPSGQDCPSCRHDIKKRLQTIVLFWDIDNEKVLVFDVVKKHMNGIYSKIDEYPDEYMDIAFTIKRIGSGNQTAYDMSPILRLKAEEKAKAENRHKAEIPDRDKLVYVKKPEELEEMLAGLVGDDDLPATPEDEM